MQVQAINNNTNFGTCRGIKCLGNFNPRMFPQHATILDEFYKSPAFQKFGERYDFIAQFLHYKGFDKYDQYCLTLTPVAAVEQKNNSAKTSLFTNLLSKNKSSDDIKLNFSVEENVEKSKLHDLPHGFMAINCAIYKNNGAYNEFIQEIRHTTIDYLDKRLSQALGVQDSTLKQKEALTSDAQRAKQIIDDLEKQGIPIY